MTLHVFTTPQTQNKTILRLWPLTNTLPAFVCWLWQTLMVVLSTVTTFGPVSVYINNYIFLISRDQLHLEQLFSVTRPWCNWNLSVGIILILTLTKPHQSHFYVLLFLFSAALKLTFTVCFQDHLHGGHLHGVGSTLIENFGCVFFVDHFMKCTNFYSWRCIVCQKSEQPPILENEFWD